MGLRNCPSLAPRRPWLDIYTYVHTYIPACGDAICTHIVCVWATWWYSNHVFYRLTWQLHGGQVVTQVQLPHSTQREQLVNYRLQA